MNVFGRYVRLRRKRAKLGLRRVAQTLGIKHVYLGEVERGERPPLERKHWPALARAIPAVTLEALEWAAASAGPVTVDLRGLDQRSRFAALATLRGDLPDEPMELQEDALHQLHANDDPGIAAAILEVLGDEQLTVEEITDTLVALGWTPGASDLTQHIGYLMHQHRELFAKAGALYGRR